MNIKTALCLIWICSSLCFGCDQNQTDTLPMIEVDLKKSDELSLSDVTKDVNLIRLETTIDSYIINLTDLLHFNDKLYIKSSNQKVLVFDMDGNYIQRLGKEGDGPGEYRFVKSIMVNEQTNEIYVASTRKVLVYSPNHDLKREVLLENSWDYIGFFEGKMYSVEHKYSIPIENGFASYTSLYEINSELSIIDTLFVREVIRPNKTASAYTHNHYLSIIDNDAYFYASVFTNEKIHRDTLYQIKESSVSPHLKLDFGQLVLNEKGIKSTLIYNIIHSKSYIICEYSHNGNKMLFLYNKKASKGYNLKEGILDEKGSPVILRPFDLSNDTFYFVKNSEYTSRSIEESNPIIGIVTLK
ncbi:6-bladed beta-propeller [Belliella sp. DSM 111904]|uniref:6-bladed beta-propeller n=1 Tax=Belliella filtrata TaxID=2923435 RepID=A0ABS9UXI4_9BACT|nr:6-bladed beta-propeller [Belliella filtrata]MCH7408890.1 6-bladed beta-propeller [Belliella filtrata]